MSCSTNFLNDHEPNGASVQLETITDFCYADGAELA